MQQIRLRQQLVEPLQEKDFEITAWSPDGKRLAVSDEGMYEADIYIINADDDAPPVHIAATRARRHGRPTAPGSLSSGRAETMGITRSG